VKRLATLVLAGFIGYCIGTLAMLVWGGMSLYESTFGDDELWDDFYSTELPNV
jgi:hypothetical protein